MFKLVNYNGETFSENGIEIYFKSIKDAADWRNDFDLEEQFPIIVPVDYVWTRTINGYCWTSSGQRGV